MQQAEPPRNESAACCENWRQAASKNESKGAGRALGQDAEPQQGGHEKTRAEAGGAAIAPASQQGGAKNSPTSQQGG